MGSVAGGARAAADRGLPATLARRVARLLAGAYRDELTGALTRRVGLEYLADEVQRARRRGSALAVAFVDVDGLKVANDTFGHAAGDALLVAVVAALSGSLRSYDRVIRYGGDEFVCVLPEATADVVTAGMDRARDLLAADHPGASFSSGVAALQTQDTPDALLRRADVALYARRATARRHGPFALPDAQWPARRLAGHAGAADIDCGRCGGQISLSDFVALDDALATRRAVCASCGETTIIQLATPTSINERRPSS